MTPEEIFQITLYHGYIPQILLAELLFVFRLERRRRFLLRFCLGLVVYAFLSVVVPNIVAHFTPGFFSFLIFLLSLGLWSFCFEGKFSEILFCCVGGQLTQNLSYHVENLIVIALSGVELSNPVRFLISVLTMGVIYTASYFVFAKRLKDGIEGVAGGYIFLIAIVSAAFVYLMQFFLQVYGLEHYWVTRPPLIVCCLFGLAAQFGFFAYKNKEKENRELELFLQKERRQYDLAKSSIDLINIKAHDLKHYIRRVQSVTAEDKEELAEIEEAISSYESSIKTGNQALDLVLTEKAHLCKANDIDLSIIAQGEELSFMHKLDVYSLVANALDNAIECESQIEDRGKRFIAFKLFQKDGLLSLSVDNYCPFERKTGEGLPETTKENKDYHGFGMKSIRYVVEKYGGVMKICAERELFSLTILFSPSK
ncbi:MAG: sensor histidine kinase [Clostridia bacterium]|nr:sensor histidine kinase [Clostridia bacterium]